MGLKRRNPARTQLFTPPQMLAALAAFTPAASAAASKPRSVSAPAQLSAAERHRRIADAAYRRAERAGFGGNPVADWLAAEREVDAMLAGGDESLLRKAS